MTKLVILEYPDPRLRKKAAPVAVVDDAMRQLADNMLETMYAAKGVGLAATQVDVHKRLIVLDVSETRDQPLVLINPELLKQEGSGPMGVGTRYKQTGRFLGKTFEMTSEVTAWEPNRKFTLKSVSGPFPFEQTTAFSRHGDVTRLDAHMEGESKGFFKLADSLVGAMGRRQFAADYANLKDLMEAGIATSSGKQQAPT